MSVMGDKSKKILYSFLDLAIVGEGKSISQTLQSVLKVAQCAEKFNYSRFWMAEHHNMANIASSATSVLIGFIASGTSKIKVGSGGVMLPNHSSLVIAEQFGTLDALYPNRIDLGIGRAPGTDQLTAMALRRNDVQIADLFPKQIDELQSYFSNTDKQCKVRAFPGEGANVPLWILGSSTESAYLAAELGLPYVFASHFAPHQLQQASRIYKKYFKPSSQLQEPYFVACVNAIVANTSEKAQFLATSFYKMFLGIIRNDRKPMQEPCDTMNGVWTTEEEAAVYNMTACSFIGTPDDIREGVQRFCDILEVDELMITTPIYDEQEKIISLELFSEVIKECRK